MALTFGPGLFDTLRKLPRQETVAHFFSHGLRVLGAVVVTEAEVGQPQGLREHPAFAIVLGAEVGDALLRVAAPVLDGGLEVRKRGQRQDGVPQFRRLVFVNAPEAFGVEGAGEGVVVCPLGWVVAVAEYPSEVVPGEAVEFGDDGVQESAETQAFVGCDSPKLPSRRKAVIFVLQSPTKFHPCWCEAHISQRKPRAEVDNTVR